MTKETATGTAEKNSVVGDCAKLREALMDVVKRLEAYVGCDHHIFHPTATTCDGITSVGKCGKIGTCAAIFKARAALAAPPRECDRFTDEKQADALHAAFIEYCNECDCPMGCDHRKNPRFLLDGNCASIMKCFARFALSKATPKEGGAV